MMQLHYPLYRIYNNQKVLKRVQTSAKTDIACTWCLIALQCILTYTFYSMPWKYTFTLLDIFQLQSYTKLRCCKLIILILISVWFQNFSYSPEEIPRNARVYFSSDGSSISENLKLYIHIQSYKKCLDSLELETANKSSI